jgi:hydrogenase nickel incorporation protein HypA/HybF
MHEYSLVQALLNRVDAEARAHHATAVHRVTVRIGPLAGVERELFATAYEHCRPGTLCRDAELVIQDQAAQWQCEVCGAPIAAGDVLVCAACGMPASLAGGDELLLERIELEVPDHV